MSEHDFGWMESVECVDTVWNEMINTELEFWTTSHQSGSVMSQAQDVMRQWVVLLGDIRLCWCKPLGF